MNKKGFTMVELIAVIAILCVLAGVGMLAVSRYVSKAKKNTYKNFESNLKGATINYLSSHPELASVNNQTIYANDLIKEGYLEKLADPSHRGSNCFNTNPSKDSYIVVTANRSEGSYNITYTYKVCLKCVKYKSSGC